MTKCKNSASELKLFVSSPCSISMNGKISGTVVRLVVNFLVIWGNRRRQTWPSCWCFPLVSYKTPYFRRFCRTDYRQTYDVINRTGSTYHVATLTEDRATDTINNLEKRWSLDIWFLRYTSGQTDRQTDTLVAILSFSQRAVCFRCHFSGTGDRFSKLPKVFS